MQEIIRMSLPLTHDKMQTLHVGDRVLLSGSMLSLRDAGHKRLFKTIADGTPAFDFVGETIYFMGPCPANDGDVIGSCGPTTGCRMDSYTPYMLDNGLSAQIGKGKRSQECLNSFVRNNCVYLCAIGGCGAVYQNCVKAVEIVCFDDLGTEAVRRLEVVDFPVVVAIDCKGNCIYND